VTDIATALSVTKTTTANVPTGATAAVPSALDAVFAALLQQLAPDASVAPPSPANDLGQAGNDNIGPAAQADASPQNAPQTAFDSSTLMALLQNSNPQPSGNAGQLATPVTAGTETAGAALQDAQTPAVPSQPQSGGLARGLKSDSKLSTDPDAVSPTRSQTDNADAPTANDSKPVAKIASNGTPDVNAVVVMPSQQMPQQNVPSSQQPAASDAASAIATATAGAKPSAPVPTKDGKIASTRAADQSQVGDDATSDSADTSAKSAAVKQIAANADTPQFDAPKVDAHTNSTSAQTAPLTDAGPNAQSSGSGQSDGSFSSAATAASVQAPAGTSSATAVGANLQVAPQHHDAATSSTLDSLGVTIAAKSADGARHFDIRLDPPDLGRVDVRLSMDDSGNARASLIVDKPQTLELLQRDASNLNRALSEAGLSLSNNGLNFSLRGQDRQDDGGSVAQGRSRSLSVKAIVGTDALGSGSHSSFAPNSVRLDIRV